MPLTETGQSAILCPYPNIAQTLRAVAQGQAELAVVPVENLLKVVLLYARYAVAA